MSQKKLAIKLPIKNISDDLIENITEFLKENKGETDLEFLVYEPESKIWVQMFSQSYKVTLSSEVTEFLDSISEIEYKILEE